jgi:hypothetical protein
MKMPPEAAYLCVSRPPILFAVPERCRQGHTKMTFGNWALAC